MGRRKKNKLTYDSKETQTFTGLVLIILGVFFGISVFSGAEDGGTIFEQARVVFGSATIFLSPYLILVGLRLLGVKMPFMSALSLMAQGLLIILLSGLMTAFTNQPWEEIKLDTTITEGGRVGYYIIVNIFGDGFPTQAATKLILMLLTLPLVPVAASFSLNKTIEILGNFLSYIQELVRKLFFYEDEEDLTLEKEEETIKASRFGDFNNLLKNKQDDSDDGPEPMPTGIPKKKMINNENINYKEGDLGADGLQQESLQFPNWQLPPLSLLFPYKKSQAKEASIKQNADIIEQILASFGIEASVEDAYIGPSVVQYALNIPLGIKVSKVATLAENIALALGVDSKAVRVDTIPETTFLGIEVPRTNRDLVRMKELMESENMQHTSVQLPVPIGKDINGDAVIGNIQKMPHLLIAGATGSGKSILTNTFITSLIMKLTPDEVKLILVDPKQVELMDYNGIPHLLTPVITDMDKVVNALKWLVGEMETRYTSMAKEQVRNIEAYNQKKGFAAMPYIVVVIDEMADMMMTSNRVESENAIVRLAQKARAVGIHLILATQRPSVNVITGIIKANIPGRIGMSVTSSTDSRVILDRIGAESLMGAGDLLFKAPDKTKAERLQSGFIEQEEVIRVVSFIKDQSPEVEYKTGITEKQLSEEEANAEALGDISGDDLIEQAIHVVVRAGKGSSSYLQRRLNIGFNRAARLLEELEEAGVVGPPNGSKPREVLVSDADSFIDQLRQSS
ncbi:DNA translocase FtsK [Candidatus Dojkabacteria bacterium]|uniref:DNA translocase FtsK n=1 Tax=Candidatus Dojkabacteria bacterium TaxID=2099670 RepID=A0A955RLK4_9BACT|nr:DNA translocase FtsK [Candidatus Dojkabacteria bacterium]